jgi:hypothetical protein
VTVYNVIESSEEQALTAEKGGTYGYTRSWKVALSSQNPNLGAIQAAVGVFTGQPGPNGTTCKTVRVQGTDSRYLYKVTAEYEKPEPSESERDPRSEPPEYEWSFEVTQEATMYALQTPSSRVRNKKILNTAGDPLEDVTIDSAEARLTITYNVPINTFSASLALGFTNSVNLNAWCGGYPGTWKCQGFGATTKTWERKIPEEEGGGSETIYYWTLTINLSYKQHGWQLRLLNIGFSERDDIFEDGAHVKIAVPRVYELVGLFPAASTKEHRMHLREQHAAIDRQALDDGGHAKPSGQEPDEIEFDVYTSVYWPPYIFPPPPS